jgi:hypothetical protein
MFILDSLFLSGFRWVLETVRNAAEAEQDDDTALREQLMAAEMRRELGEIADDEFAAIEADLLARIREIKERREGGSGPIAFGGESSSDAQLAVEATVEGDFHEPAIRDPQAATRDPQSVVRGPRSRARQKPTAPASPRGRRKIRKP